MYTCLYLVFNPIDLVKLYTNVAFKMKIQQHRRRYLYLPRKTQSCTDTKGTFQKKKLLENSNKRGGGSARVDFPIRKKKKNMC